jgi:hypothetical protein
VDKAKDKVNNLKNHHGSPKNQRKTNFSNQSFGTTSAGGIALSKQ